MKLKLHQVQCLPLEPAALQVLCENFKSSCLIRACVGIKSQNNNYDDHYDIQTTL